jgi:hypothetical protein
MTTEQWIKIFGTNKNLPAVHNDVYNIGVSLSDRITVIERLLKADELAVYKEFTYDGDGNITNQDIYEDNTKVVMLFRVVYGYTGDDITTITVTEESSGFVYVKTLAYDINGNLESITIV